jgi:N-acetylglucosamine-6-sulfatase
VPPGSGMDRPMTCASVDTTRVGTATRRALLVAVAGAALLLGVPALAAQDAIARPNVVVVMTDDQDARSIGVMPNVERELARQGATFEDSYATFPLCCPSRATFLTGQYAHNHGVTSNNPPDGGFRAFDDRQTLPVRLNRAGYRTGFIGKYLNGYGREGGGRRYVPPGWDDWFGIVRGGLFGYALNENRRIQDYGRKARDYQTDVLMGKAEDFIRRSSRERAPFFLTVSPQAPHSDRRDAPRPAPRHEDEFQNRSLPRPPSFNERDVSDKPSFVSDTPRLSGEARERLKRFHRARLASLLAIDEGVGDIVSQLRRSGELGNTLIVYTSDNGYLQGEHRLRGKTLLYEESAKVPLLLRGPGVPAGVERRQLTGNIDLAATILDAARASSRRVLDGISLMPLAREPNEGSDRDILLENSGSTAIRSGPFMYAEHPSNEAELYDLRDDPFQLESLHDDPRFAAERQSLSQRLRQLERCAGASCR